MTRCKEEYESLQTFNDDVYNCVISNEKQSLAGFGVVHHSQQEAASQSYENNNEDRYQWFVLRDLTRPNAKLPGYKLLEQEMIKCFTPMHFVIKRKDGKNTRLLEPVLRSLLFAYVQKEVLDVLMQRHKTLQYRYVYGHSINNPMIVPKKDMDKFIHAIESSCSDPIYYSMRDVTPDKYGKKVRIIGGNLDGYTGRLLRMQGSKIKRLLIELNGLCVAGVEVQAEYIQFV